MQLTVLARVRYSMENMYNHAHSPLHRHRKLDSGFTVKAIDIMYLVGVYCYTLITDRMRLK